MKKRLFRGLFIILVLAVVSSIANPNGSNTRTRVKCMVQLTNYSGEGAYIVVSALDSDGNYLDTLHLLGDDDEWYPDLASWWAYFESVDKPKVDAITGATIAGGERSIFVMEIEESMIDKGNLLRFETAVEDQKYHGTDLEIPLTSENLKGSFNGTGYIRYVRMVPN